MKENKTDRQIDRQTYTQIDRQTYTQIDRQTDRERKKCRNIDTIKDRLAFIIINKSLSQCFPNFLDLAEWSKLVKFSSLIQILIFSMNCIFVEHLLDYLRACDFPRGPARNHCINGRIKGLS